jgi:phosphoribosylaminoimidazolecarboxamide formyltransferase/IMP cyclohydrolase
MTDHQAYPAEKALISVFDKTGLVDFAKRLQKLGIEILATGGTAAALRDAGVPVTSISEITGFPEILEGRVKTLHPNIHGGILAKLNQPAHRKALAEHGIPAIGLVVINLYPFEEAARSGKNDAFVIENIDIGGPAMLRAAAKNHAFVTAICDPGDYNEVASELETNARVTARETRARLAAKVFARTAAYDGAIAKWFAASLDETAAATYTLSGRLKQKLRYGENPHQKAALYADPLAAGEPSVVAARQLQGKELSYNNIADADAAFMLVSELPSGRSAAIIIKHANPCGAALGSTLLDAYAKALACDPVSAFGGIVAVNRTLDGKAATEIVKIFTEVVLAPDASEEAQAIFAAKPNLRLLLTGGLASPRTEQPRLRSVQGGFLVQGPDYSPLDGASLRVVTQRQPANAEMADLRFAFALAKHVKSNAIVFVRDSAAIGIGAGQMSRVDSVRIAIWKAREAAKAAGRAENEALAGTVVGSDAFFPFADGVEAAAEAGATAIIQPGGSMRDEDVIAAADRLGLAMVFTGIRHFRH